MSAIVKTSFFHPKGIGFFKSCKFGVARTKKLIDYGLHHKKYNESLEDVKYTHFLANNGHF